MRFPPRTILGQLVAGSVAVQVVVFAAFLGISVRHEVRETQQRDRQRLVRQADTLANVLRIPLATQDAELLSHITNAIPISLTIGSVRVTDRDGNTLRTSGKGLAPALNEREHGVLEDLMLHPGYQLKRDEQGGDQGVETVVSNGMVHGVVWITADRSVTRRLTLMNVQSLSVYGACALLGNLLLVWWLSASTARPLRELRYATQQVRNNPSDLSSFPLPATSRNETGELQASFNSMVEELTRQRRGTQETLGLLDSLLERAPVGFAFFNREFRFVRLNKTLAEMNGLPLQAHLGLRYRDLLSPDVSLATAIEAEELVQRVFDTGIAMADQELTIVKPDGSSLQTWQATIFPVHLADEEVRWVGIIALDRTERKLAEDALRRSERLASAGRLAASIAHEINNPLESVTNLLYLLRMSKSLDWEAQEYVALAQTEIGRAAEITQQTLKFHRRSTLPADVRLPEVLQSVLLLHQARLQSGGIDVQLDLSEKAISFGFVGELRQVFANLIGNAIDAMPQGGRLRVRARAARRLGRRGTRVTIADTGAGMPDAVRQRIFEPFFTTKEVSGTGVGLWVSTEILSKHQATMQVRSRVAIAPLVLSGTVFSIFLPWDGVPRGPVIVT